MWLVRFNGGWGVGLAIDFYRWVVAKAHALEKPVVQALDPMIKCRSDFFLVKPIAFIDLCPHVVCEVPGIGVVFAGE